MRVGPQLKKFKIKAKTNARLLTLAFKSRWKKKNKGKNLNEERTQSFMLLLLPNGKLTKSLEKLLGQGHVV